jgi:hypothetical protein
MKGSILRSKVDTLLIFANICLLYFQTLSLSLTIFTVWSAAECYDRESKLFGLSRMFVDVSFVLLDSATVFREKSKETDTPQLPFKERESLR